MKVFVTGAAGYVASHVIVELVANGVEVLGVDNFSNAHPSAVDRLTSLTGEKFDFEVLDLRDRSKVKKAVIDRGIDAVLHFAGLKSVSDSVAVPLNYYENNVAGSVNLLLAMEAAGIFKFVFSSSATVYGEPSELPLHEASPVNPALNPYGQTKLQIELMLRELAKSNKDWSIAALRYFNPIGAHPSGMIGENPRDIPNNLMPYMLDVAVGERTSLSIYGADYDTIDGTGVRDYIHIMDLASGHIAALHALFKKNGVHTYNLGTGEGTSVLQLLRTFESSTGRTIPFTVAPRRPGDVASCYADANKAFRELDWNAKHTIEEMCCDALRWRESVSRFNEFGR